MFQVSLTAGQLCELVEMGFTRFETLRRRARQQFDFSDDPSTPFDMEAYLPFPLKNYDEGKWVRYDLEDALSLAVALRLEASGFNFKAACSLVINAGVRDFLLRPADAVDFWIARFVLEDGSAGHSNGSQKDVQVRLRQAQSGTLLNVSAVARDLVKRAASQGLI